MRFVPQNQKIGSWALRQRVYIVMALLVGIVLAGTIGYWLLEGWSLLDSLYMTVITLTTVGFSETRPLSPSGRLFTIVLIVFGVATLAFATSVLIEYTFSLAIGQELRRKWVQRMIDKLDNHIIVCGYGRVGENAVLSLRQTGRSFVIIESDIALAEQAQQEGALVIAGDATQDDNLKAAGIERANGLLVCTGSDVANLFIVLSARTLNPTITIVSRSTDDRNDAKMVRAGANQVVSPYRISGRHMANRLIRPNVTEFLDVVTLDDGLELVLEEVVVGQGSSLIGSTIIESDMRRRTGATLVALRRAATGMTMQPSGEDALALSDSLIVLGTREQLLHVERLASAISADLSASN